MGIYRVATRQGIVREIDFFQDQRIVREICKLSGKLGNIRALSWNFENKVNIQA